LRDVFVFAVCVRQHDKEHRLLLDGVEPHRPILDDCHAAVPDGLQFFAERGDAFLRDLIACREQAGPAQ